MKPAAIVLALVLTACGGETTPPPAPEPPVEPARPALEGPLVQVRATDLDGTPLPGMLPIATHEANAFDTPVVYGDKTDASGESGLVLPRVDRLWVRTWDPNFEWFAVNVYDVVANVGDHTELLEVRMARAGSVAATLLDADGDLHANRTAGLRMTHPARGPWWHAEAQSNAVGRIVFEGVPPGEYTIGIVLDTGERAEWGTTRIDPGASVDLGNGQLR
jgi:hypothetical protein